MSGEFTEESLVRSIAALQQRYTSDKAKKETIEDYANRTRDAIDHLEKENEKLTKVLQLYQMTSEFAREQSKTHIEQLVTSCLRIVFPEEISFVIDIVESGRNTNANFLIADTIDGTPSTFQPQDARGGGVVDVVSLALRISFLLRYHPPVEGILILDEPAKHVSEEYIHNVAELLLQVAEEFSLQIILVTHNRHLAYMGETVYEVSHENNSSSVKAIESIGNHVSL